MFVFFEITIKTTQVLAEVRGQSREDYNGGTGMEQHHSPASKIRLQKKKKREKKTSTRNQMRETSDSTESRTKDQGSLQYEE